MISETMKINEIVRSPKVTWNIQGVMTADSIIDLTSRLVALKNAAIAMNGMPDPTPGQ